MNGCIGGSSWLDVCLLADFLAGLGCYWMDGWMGGLIESMMGNTNNHNNNEEL